MSKSLDEDFCPQLGDSLLAPFSLSAIEKIVQLFIDAKGDFFVIALTDHEYVQGAAEFFREHMFVEVSDQDGKLPLRLGERLFADGWQKSEVGNYCKEIEIDNESSHRLAEFFFNVLTEVRAERRIGALGYTIGA